MNIKKITLKTDEFPEGVDFLGGSGITQVVSGETTDWSNEYFTIQNTSDKTGKFGFVYRRQAPVSPASINEEATYSLIDYNSINRNTMPSFAISADGETWTTLEVDPESWESITSANPSVAEEFIYKDPKIYGRTEESQVENPVAFSNSQVFFELEPGLKMYICGDNYEFDWKNYPLFFLSNVSYDAMGNILTLIHPNIDLITELAKQDNKSFSFRELFKQDTNIRNTKNLYIPELVLDCFEMFRFSYIHTAPKLVGEVLSESSYAFMFANTPFLRRSPILPATGLAPRCYESMFEGSGIENLPILPALLLKEECYKSMFYDCISLQEEAILKFTDSALNALETMFAYSGILKATIIVPSHFDSDSTLFDNFLGSCIFKGCYDLREILIKAPHWGTNYIGTNVWTFFDQNDLPYASGIIYGLNINQDLRPEHWKIQQVEYDSDTLSYVKVFEEA